MHISFYSFVIISRMLNINKDNDNNNTNTTTTTNNNNNNNNNCINKIVYIYICV